ncbi:DNA mismatch repair protein MutT [Niastella vici]|uniref:DNA mismatch repair protein MutT n=1 Tax=Niastella vici TaxID=1703345 RepID=A0A1V9FWD6_9BACT|nr:metallophosphoesterase [Niastella vici]OQP62679.1 DNA mismatch repair protein MutT [Niastella vici]
MRNSGFFFFLLGLMALLDIYIFQVIQVVLPASSKARLAVIIGYWVISVSAMLIVVLMPYVHFDNWPRWVVTYVRAIVIGLFISKVIASIFFAVDDLRRGGTWLVSRIAQKPSPAIAQNGAGITRSVFLSWLGLAVGGTVFSTLVYGFGNKYRYQVNRMKMSFKNLPAAFKGMRIVHISDIHSGSFMDKEAVEKGVKKILKEKPDVILFTGDLVNDRAIEMKDYIDVFNKLNAPLGVYSTLGNHDYGDYVRWDSHEAKKENLEQLKQVHKQMGWRLLMNEHVVLEKGADRIALLGIENWSAKGNFGRYGKMEEAYPGSEQYPFKILMSHDPSHWDAEVRTKYGDIDLTLAGHTHGMQFGVELPGFRWSPVQYMYKQWAGLYESGNQKLYVNRGYGFIGYPGRVGILPEITVIELS